jgi:GNAT superfamily N-acetyltransferase
VLYGTARPGGEPAVAVSEAADTMAAARLILDAFGVPPDVAQRHGPALVEAAGRSGGRLYLAAVEERPVAGAILTIRDGIGYLAMAGTLPEFRGLGCQGALIAARAAAAAAAGCELVVATAEFASASQRNLERAGLRVAYTKPVLRLTARAERPPAATA